MKVNELIEFIENHSIPSLYHLEDYEEMNNVERVASGLDLDQHRWYSTAINVYKCDDGYVGIRSGYQIFSEDGGFEDLDIKTIACEYEEIMAPTYKRKKKC